MVAGPDSHGRVVVQPDPTGTAPGRGAHLHPTSECYDQAVRRKAFARALRRQAGAEFSSALVADYLDSLNLNDPT